MLTRIELKLKTEGQINFQMSSLFHGAMMEYVDIEYAEQMHISRLHPYSSHIELRDGDWYWIICTLNDEARKHIIDGALLNLDSFKIKKKDISVEITERKIIETNDRDIVSEFYKGEYSKYINVQVITPLAFKQRGSYVFYPNIRCIYQSLMNKFTIAANDEMYDEDTLDYLSENTVITRYNLKSLNFSMEGVRIPGFIGTFTLKVSGAQTMINLANSLFKVGEYSGIGIKTSIGMGAIKLKEVDHRK